MFEAKDPRERSRQEAQIGQELRVALKPILHTPAWEALEAWVKFEIEGELEALSNPGEPFDMVRYRQGELARLREILQLKLELLKS